ncbi:MAG: IclR family transcriptional regulator [Deltaproteobacteria bacterium]|nr:IclR family transcriptional regulator [Deltaproteobacteria bacterium]
MTESSKKLNAVEKALKIIQTLADHENGLGTGGLSEKLGFTMSTVSRLLKDLSRHDFVKKSPAGKNYVLGKSIIDIGRVAFKHIGTQLLPIAKPYIDALRDKIEENATLEVLNGDNVMLVYRAGTPHAIGIFLKTGAIVPAHVSPGAKAILAFSPTEIVDATLKKKLSRYTSKTITDLEVFKAHFKEIRRKGVAFASGEYDNNINSLGAPIFDSKKNPVAAVVITIPKFRARYHNQAKLISLIKETADKISEQIEKQNM